MKIASKTLVVTREILADVISELKRRRDHRNWRREYVRRRRIAGICTRCGAPSTGTLRCSACTAKALDYNRRWLDEHRPVQKICARCGQKHRRRDARLCAIKTRDLFRRAAQEWSAKQSWRAYGSTFIDRVLSATEPDTVYDHDLLVAFGAEADAASPRGDDWRVALILRSLHGPASAKLFGTRVR